MNKDNDMGTCATCGNLGLSETEAGDLSACTCPAGDAIRTHPTERDHTDQHDERLESIRESVGAKLRAAGYREPVLPPSAHVCASCAGPLLEGQPPGAWCRGCSDKRASLVLEFKREDWRITAAWCVGIVCGLLIAGLIYWGTR
jgi:hypothetical protein